MKRFAKLLCLVITLILITGCGGSKEEKGTTNNASKSKGNYNVFEAVKKIDTSSTIEEINTLIGFEGTIKSESDETSTIEWKLYRWDLTEDTAIEIRYYSSTKNMYVEAIFPTSMIKTKTIDFSNVKTEMKAINSTDGLKYEDVVKILGGVEGTLTKKDKDTLTYEWYGKERGSMTARFSTKTGKCTSYNGLF